MTDGSAQMYAAFYEHDAVVAAPAPICGERFRTQGMHPRRSQSSCD
jgi:hypothetical protein